MSKLNLDFLKSNGKEQKTAIEKGIRTCSTDAIKGACSNNKNSNIVICIGGIDTASPQ